MLTFKNKMMAMTLVLSAGAFMGAAPHVAWAETPVPQTTAQIGAAVPIIGDLKDVADPGFYLGAQALHRVDAHNGVGMNISYMSFGKDSMDGVDTETSIISMVALMHHAFAEPAGGTPFIEGGFGFARTQVNIKTGNGNAAPILQGTNQEDISPTVLIGLGFDAPISNGATFGVSVDYQHFFFKVGNVDGGGSLSLLAHLRV